ncbi:MAG: DUF5596 domain-containing protein [Clostridiales bacterium]|nr:DUF5596 domain-containing protein [Clostridiales bacterium]
MNEIVNELAFPVEAQKEILYCRDLLANNSEFQELIQKAEQEYKKNGTLDYAGLSDKAGVLAEKTGVNSAIGMLLFFLYLCPIAKTFYAKKGLDDKIYKDSFYDLTIKALECKQVQGVWGTHTNWFGRFFDLTRFKLGRLEFEEKEFDFDYLGFKKGTQGINVHIPSCGPLPHEECLHAYQQAAEFYRKLQKHGKVLFFCSSWLLAEEMKLFLAPDANIRQFADDYDIIYTRTVEGFPDAWRVFGADYQKPADKLPRNTLLQKGYADYLLTHDTTTVSLGVFVYDIAKQRICHQNGNNTSNRSDNDSSEKEKSPSL